MDERVRAMFAEAGLPMAQELTRVPNSRRALIVSELARDRGLHAQLHPRLFDAYWARNLDLGDSQVLIEEGEAVGLGADAILGALEDPAYLERIEAHTDAAVTLGAGGVPAWLIDERVLVPGAQPHEVFERVLERLGSGA
jgi:predicted DsbA family dithiol-disulfide isomerase